MSRLEIVPADFQVQAGTSFEITTRAFDGAGHVVPITGAALAWKLDGADPGQLSLKSQSGNEARFDAVKAAGSPVKISATVGLASAQATAMVVPTAIGNTEPVDVIKAPHGTEAPLAFSLLDGERNGLPVANEFVAFAAGARIKNLEGAGAFLVFSAERRLLFSRVADWKAGQEVVTAPTGIGTLPVTVPVRLWDATSDGLSVFPDLAVAQYVFRSNRTGVRIEQEGAGGLPTRIAPAAVFTDDCTIPEARFGTDVFDPTALALHVFVVQSVEFNLLGWACKQDPDATRRARVIFLSVNRFSTTLAHELGHILALLEPANGHTDCAPAFNETNLMWRWTDDLQSSNRLDLSLGQAFRVASDQRSWVYALGLSAMPDPPSCNVAGSPCPPLSHPVIPPDVWVAPGYCPT